MIICYTVPEIWHMTDAIIFHFQLFFVLLQHKKSKFWKNERKPWRYHHFTYVHQKLWSDDVRFPRYGAQWTDGQTDGGWKKQHIEAGAPPKNKQNILQKHSQNKYLFRHFYFFCFISTQFTDFDILTFAKSFNVLNNVAWSVLQTKILIS